LRGGRVAAGLGPRQGEAGDFPTVGENIATTTRYLFLQPEDLAERLGRVAL
jgi:hypothetical protein